MNSILPRSTDESIYAIIASSDNLDASSVRVKASATDSSSISNSFLRAQPRAHSGKRVTVILEHHSIRRNDQAINNMTATRSILRKRIEPKNDTEKNYPRPMDSCHPPKQRPSNTTRAASVPKRKISSDRLSSSLKNIVSPTRYMHNNRMLKPEKNQAHPTQKSIAKKCSEPTIRGRQQTTRTTELYFSGQRQRSRSNSSRRLSRSVSANDSFNSSKASVSMKSNRSESLRSSVRAASAQGRSKELMNSQRVNCPFNLTRHSSPTRFSVPNSARSDKSSSRTSSLSSRQSLHDSSLRSSGRSSRSHNSLIIPTKQADSGQRRVYNSTRVQSSLSKATRIRPSIVSIEKNFFPVESRASCRKLSASISTTGSCATSYSQNSPESVVHSAACSHSDDLCSHKIDEVSIDSH